MTRRTHVNLKSVCWRSRTVIPFRVTSCWAMPQMACRHCWHSTGRGTNRISNECEAVTVGSANEGLVGCSQRERNQQPINPIHTFFPTWEPLLISIWLSANDSKISKVDCWAPTACLQPLWAPLEFSSFWQSIPTTARPFRQRWAMMRPLQWWWLWWSTKCEWWCWSAPIRREFEAKSPECWRKTRPVDAERSCRKPTHKCEDKEKPFITVSFNSTKRTKSVSEANRSPLKRTTDCLYTQW